MPAIARKSTRHAFSSVVAAVCTVWMAPFALSEPPSLEQAIGAWIDARAWVDAMEVPDAPAVPAPPARTGGVPRSETERAPVEPPLHEHGSTAIVLRYGGRVVGTGVDFGPAPDQLRRAVAAAIDRALLDDFIHVIPREERGQIGRRLALELEIASEPEPMPGRAIGQIIQRFEPALDAIALRRGEHWVWAMPSVAQASNLASDPVRACVALLQDLAVDPRDLPTQELPDSMAFYRASTRRLAQRAAPDSPFEVIRGREVIPITALNDRGRLEFAQALARHLDAHIVRPSAEVAAEATALKPLGIKGDYRPHLDINRSLSAAPQDQGLAAWSLAAYATLDLAPIEERSRAAAAASELLVALADVADIEEDPIASRTGVAFALLADATLATTSFEKPRLPPRFREQLITALTERLSGAAVVDHTRAVEITAAAVLASRGEPIVPAAKLRALIDEAWTPPVGSTIVGTIPWLLMAERASGTFADPVHAARIAALVEPLRQALITSQLGVGGPEESSPDAAGGFVLAGSGGPLTGSQSARPALAGALMLAEPVLTPDAALPDAMRSQLMALRFLRQLTVDDRSSYAFRDREKSIGGVSEALWDTTQPVAATAVTLLVVVESERGLRAAAGRAKARPGIQGNRSNGPTGDSP